MRFLYSLAFVCALVSATGCARTWPQVSGVADARFLQSGGVRSVAIVPLDVTVGVAESVDEPPDSIAAKFEGAARAGMVAELTRRGYEVVGPEVEADAVLSLAGFSYAGHEDHSGEVVGAVIACILIVGIIALIAGSKDHGSHHGGGHGHGGGVHHIGHAPVHVASRGPYFAHHVSIGVVLPPGPVVEDVPADGDSHSLLALRLIERESGRVLWSAEANLPASPRDAGDVELAMARLAASLPPAR